MRLAARCRPAQEVTAKCRLLRWRLHALLAEWTRDVAHAYEAALARPDLAAAQTLLGEALAAVKRPASKADRPSVGLRIKPLSPARALKHTLAALTANAAVEDDARPAQELPILVDATRRHTAGGQSHSGR